MIALSCPGYGMDRLLQGRIGGKEKCSLSVYWRESFYASDSKKNSFDEDRTTEFKQQLADNVDLSNSRRHTQSKRDEGGKIKRFAILDRLSQDRAERVQDSQK